MDDKFLWLEEVEGADALAFAAAESEKTKSHLSQNPLFAQIKNELAAIHASQDRLPLVTQRGDYLYNFWQDKIHIHGVWRRIPLKDFAEGPLNWELILDLDQLSEQEKENWVWQGPDFLEPENELCLLFLSRGGSDACVVREFNVKTKQFVAKGFNLPEAKSKVSWKDQESLFLGTDFGPGSLTNSGYPRTIRLWKRGQPLSEAEIIFTGEAEDMLVSAWTLFDSNQKKTSLLFRIKGFFEAETWEIQEDGSLLQIPIPLDAQFQGAHGGDYLFSLRSNWVHKKTEYVAGSLLGMDGRGHVQEIFRSTASIFLNASFSPVMPGKSLIYLNILDNIQGKILACQKIGGRWETREIAMPGPGYASMVSSSIDSDFALFLYEDFLTPPSLYKIEEASLDKPVLLRKAATLFDSSEMIFTRKQAVSPDGTSIPYFIVHKENLQWDGKNPTFIYGYGGFELPVLPMYLNQIGKAWLERGGVYVLAHLRGGGEFGPVWHQAVLKEKRQKVFEDLIAVAEDLISTKLTSAEHLGIVGGSNGGLLTGATFVKRPDLFKAVVSKVPLLDMLRYHKLLAGASWIAEYGDPDDLSTPHIREAILAYSPYQNVKAHIKYPEVLLMTSRKDDRVHPGHARKMAAKMREQGHPIFYFENQEGGHAGGADFEQRVLWQAIEFTYLWEKLSR